MSTSEQVRALIKAQQNVAHAVTRIAGCIQDELETDTRSDEHCADTRKNAARCLLDAMHGLGFTVEPREGNYVRGWTLVPMPTRAFPKQDKSSV